MPYNHIFFDLDRTLWDFNSNSRAALCIVFERFNLKRFNGWDSPAFIGTYERHNNICWTLFRQGRMSPETLRTERFRRTIPKSMGGSEQLYEALSQAYILESAQQTRLIPCTLLVLDRLLGQYSMHILTNGFGAVQYAKLKNSGLLPYFGEVITSEAAGAIKPDRATFNYALKKVQCKPNNALMVGDDLVTDIRGAKNAGLDQVYFNPDGVRLPDSFTPTYMIHNLKQLLGIL